MSAASDDSSEVSQDGDGDLDALLISYLPVLRAYVRLNLPPDVRARESCSDLVQSVCRDLIEQREQFEYRGHKAFRAWLFEWAIHKIRDHAKYHRAKKRTARQEAEVSDLGELAELYASVGSPSACAIARENVALIEGAFAALEPDDRQIIALCRIAGLPRDEVAGIMGKSVGAVRTQLSRALVRLGGELDKLGAEP